MSDFMSDFLQDRRMVADFMRRLYERALTTSGGGNISLRAEEHTLITPSGLDKGKLSENDIGIISSDGKNLTPNLKLSIETEMHLRVLRRRPDINAVIHAHPPTASAFAVSKTGISLDTTLTSEAQFILGQVLFARYAPMGTPELAANVESAVGGANVILMENHGVLTVGKTLLEAFDRMEVLENTAKMNWIIKSMKG